jgi:hypothetical protein
MRFFAIFIAFSAFLLLTGCAKENTHTGHSANSNAATPPDVVKSYSVSLTTAPSEIEAEKAAELIFMVKDPFGKPLNDLEITHEKPMHLLIVSDDLAEFYHLHPDAATGDSYKVSQTFPYGGKFKVFVDFKPKGAETRVETIDLTVKGAARAKTELAADEALEKAVGGIRAVMKPSEPIFAGKDVMLNYEVFDAQSGKPTADLENYLGEKAHFVIISRDLKEFVHAHPMSGASKHEEHGGAHKDGVGISAHVKFPKPELYKIWAQFKRAGKVINIPFVINVAEGKQTAAADPNEVKFPAGATRVIVNETGFVPAEIELKKGQPAKLAFYRVNKENCADEVMFAGLNVKKTLPVGEILTIDIPAESAGEFSFTCGMNMLKGKVIVQ